MSWYSSQRSQQSDELFELFDAYTKGELAAEGIARLNGILANDAAARRQFVGLAHVEALAEQFESHEFAEATIDAMIAAHEPSVISGQRSVTEEIGRDSTTHRSPLTTHPSHPSRSRRNFAIGIVAGFVAVAAMVGWMAVTYLPNVANNDKSASDLDAKPTFIARFTRGHEDEWLDGTKPPANDPRLDPGARLAIASGIIEITYNTGAKVLIEGPAEFYVGGTEAEGTKAQGARDEGGRMKDEESGANVHPSSFILHPSNSGFLKSGRLVARVSDQRAHGFTIQTPSATLTDLGTEFAVIVSDAGKTAVEVFEGRVELASVDGEGLATSRKLLTAGEAMEVEASGEIATRDSFARQVVRSDEFAKLTAPKVELLGLYTFEGDANDQSDHENHATKVSNVKFVDGYEGRAAQFAGRVDSYIDLPIDVAVDTEPVITWGAWVRPTAFKGKGCEVLSTDDNGYDRVLTIDTREGQTPTGEHRFALFTGNGVLPSSADAAKLREWTFVAGIYDQRSRAAAIFVEDREQARLVVDFRRDTNMEDSLRFIRVGMHAGGVEEPFAGEIDNVFVLRGACDEQQLERIRKLGAAGIRDVAGLVGSEDFGATVQSTAIREERAN
ncbi:MAG: FecR domain-containing protein [Pirellulales bacterium]|nr:FecR domain-containing protein [Pirellulales bacterium]